MRYLLALLIAAVPSVAHSGGICRTCVVQQRVVRYAQPFQVVTQLQAPVYAQVGLHLQQQAQAVAGFRLSPEYLEFQQLKGYVQGQNALLQMQAMQSQSYPQADGQEAPAVDPSQPESGPPEELPPTAPQVPHPPDPGPEAPEDVFANRFPMLATKCMTCHTGDTPPPETGPLWLDGTIDLSGPDAAPKRDAILRVVYTGKMPKDGPPLTPQEQWQLARELYALSAEGQH